MDNGWLFAASVYIRIYNWMVRMNIKNKMNKKGQVMIFGFMIFVVLIILAMALSFPTRQRAEDVRNTTFDNGIVGLDCLNSSISDYEEAACYAVDITPAVYIGLLIALGGIILTARILFS